MVIGSWNCRVGVEAVRLNDAGSGLDMKGRNQ